VCYRLLLAGSLTLSEVRAMLPDGLTAHVLDPASGRLVFGAPGGNVLELCRGRCACDFFLERAAGRDETALRSRWATERTPRDARLAALAVHRAQPDARPLAHWSRALATFAREYARSGGPALYLRTFGDGLDDVRRLTPLARAAAELPDDAGQWLPEGHPILVTP
jgi:hypothetical protein